MAKYCSICKRPIDTEDPAVLTIGGYGTPKHICTVCEGTIDKMMTLTEYDEIMAECKTLGEALTGGDTGDGSVISTVNELIDKAAERAQSIKDGTYSEEEDGDSADADGENEDNEESYDDIPEELRETEEDRALDEKEARNAAIFNTVTTWASGIILVAAIGFFIYKLLF